MRIQHNIMAMSAYRNYNTNTSAVAKNLEKLSSGYKINRAGDDAAGLAISEKMRAQITGLNAAQKNVKDGISLVKTAEGAMQEIQDMLNRMDYLATQSANGTYDNEVDRANLQKEMDALKAEINRIADSANFNGINLLDGSKAATSTSALGGASAVMTESVDGSAPTKAGAAEITLKLANNAATASSPLSPTGQADGTVPSEATKATLTMTMGKPANVTFDVAINGDTTNSVTGAANFNSGATFAAGDTVKVNLADGTTQTYTFAAAKDDANREWTTVAELKAQMAADGITLNDGTAATTTGATAPEIVIDGANGVKISIGDNVSDIKDLVYDNASGAKLGDLFDVQVFAKGNDAAKADTDAIAAEDKIVLTAKKAGAQDADIDTAMAAVTASSGGTVDYVKGVDEGKATSAEAVTKYDLEIDLSKLRGGQYIEIGGNKINFNTDGTAASTTEIDLNDTDHLAANLDAALDALFGNTNFKAAVSKVDGNTLKYSIEGISNAKVDDSNMGQVRLYDHDGTEADKANSAFVKSDYTPAAKGTAPAVTPGPFAKLEYKIATDDLTEGSKITIGGKVIEIAATADLANGKVTKAGINTELAKALEQLGYDSGKVTVSTDGDDTKIAIEGITIGEKASDFQKGAGSVSFLNAADAPASEVKVTGGMTITAGTTKISDIKAAAMPNAADGTAKTLNDLFNITVNGNTVADDYVIAEGDEIKFTAKNNGKYADDVISKFNFEGNVDSLTKKNGWDEGSGATGDKTHYELAIDLSKVAGGNSFTFGNVNGKSYTFDLSFDPAGTKNDTIGSNDKDDIAGNSERTTINLYGLSTADAQKAIFDQVKAKMGTDFDVTRSISGSKMTLNLDAKQEGPDYNYGNIRLSSASGALTNAVYTPAGGAAGGTEGTMAQVTYNFDASQLQSGDSLTLGGTTIYIGDETKTETVDGKVKITVSAEDAKADPNDAIVKALESAGYRSGQVKFDTDNNKITITGIKTGETAEELAKGGAALTLSGGGRELVKGGLTLQIGDTSDDFNQMTVSIGDMHTGETGLKIDGVRIDTQDGAKAAVQTIKNAINYVSGIRGDLGATQNRLEHTANNLSIMAENIQDAESTIRDTDIAEEMMAYTKNNILVQSAQAMLAQANQVPQGVLQLLG